MRIWSVHSLAVVLLVLLTSGCINPFAPSLTDEGIDKNLILTEQHSPEEVLINFSYAYNFKDSLVYSDLLDSSFLFISKNFATDPVTDLTWGRDIDIKTTVGMFRHFETLNLIWEGTVYSRFINQEKTLKEIKKIFNLTINGGTDIPTLRGEALFLFKKKILNESDTTGIWTIIRWEDLATF